MSGSRMMQQALKKADSSSRRKASGLSEDSPELRGL